MTKLTKKELKIGKKQIEGPLVLCWVVAILFGMALLSGVSLGTFGMISGYLKDPLNLEATSNMVKGFIELPFQTMYSLLLPALFVVELIGLYQRKAFAIPLGRAALVITMVLFFPIGTIFGGVMWKRFNHPLAKKYLNYEDEHIMEADEKAQEDKK